MDIFSLFSGGKKKSSGVNARGNRETDSEQQQLDFVLVGQDHNSSYYGSGATILTNENIRSMGSSASVPDNNAQVVYPSIDISKVKPEIFYTCTSNLLHDSVSSNNRYSSPLDNIPFAFQIPGLSGEPIINGNSMGLGDEFNDIAERLRRVEQFVQSSGFVYNFHLESSILTNNA